MVTNWPIHVVSPLWQDEGTVAGLFILSVCPSICGWNVVESFGWISSCLHKSPMTCDANCGPRSDTMLLGSPWFFHMYIMEIESGSIKSCGRLVARNKLYFLWEVIYSTTTRIESNLFDSGKSVVKSAMTSVHGMSSSSRGWSFPCGARLDGFIRAHLLHQFVYSLMNVLIPGQVELLWTSSSVFSLPGCPVIGVSWWSLTISKCNAWSSGM